MEKSPAARYDTARAFAEDLRRYLNDLPIIAKPPSLAQRLAKFSRRHKAAVTAAVAIVVVAVSALLWAHEKSERRSAEARQVVAEKKKLLAQIRTFVHDRKWDRANDAFRAAIALDDADIITIVAYPWMKIEQFKHSPALADSEALERADGYCVHALDIDPAFPPALNYHGILLKKMRRYDEAIVAATKLAEAQPSNFAAWTNLGAYHALVGDLSLAEECLRRAVTLAKKPGAGRSKDLAFAFRNLAALEMFLARPSADDTLAQAIEADPHDVTSWLLRVRQNLALAGSTQGGGAAAAGRGQRSGGLVGKPLIREALFDANHADRLAGHSQPKAKRMLALVHLHAGELAPAVTQAALALKYGDMPTVNHLVLAIASAKANQIDAARDHVATAESKWPQQLRREGFVATYDKGILWFDSAAELHVMRKQVDDLLSIQENAEWRTKFPETTGDLGSTQAKE